ncbi:MAG TPA: DUF5939 domain-containing protein [Verrucomicrobiae bacterium]|nr:DUF5939 domain-containing protein [Verrucomicrobiae bacterium]
MIRFQIEQVFSAPPEAVWPHVRQTDWLNRAVGLPAVHYTTEALPEGGSKITACARLLGVESRWREFPFEWVEPKFYRVRRIFAGGPFAEARLGMDLAPQHSAGTRVLAYAELEPRGALGKLFGQYVVGPKMRRDMARALGKLEDFLRGAAPLAFPDLPVTPVREDALAASLQKLRASQPRADLMEKLEHFLRTAPDVELTHIRPLAMARRWECDGWETLEFFLHATRSGVFQFSWETLCPHCRSTRRPRVRSLAGLQGASECDVCQIKFDAEFDKSVELKFAVDPAVRPAEEQTFCLAGPGGKPHVVSQAWLEPGETRAWNWPRTRRQLWLQSPQVRQRARLEAAGGKIQVDCPPAEFVVRALAPASPESATLEAELHNPNSFPVLVSVQDEAWSEDILTAARVTNWQGFHDLFSSEVISPTEQVIVGSQVILFTDLRGSTAMYSGLGDAPAYVLVRNHFAVLTEAIGAHRGRIVKTIGDAVMAAFSGVDEALAAVRRSFLELPRANPGLASPLVLKASLHLGPCLAVNANDRLDFFGTTVNLAARMVESCRGDDLTVSDELFQRPEMAAFVKQCGSAPEPAEVQCRGIPAPQRVWRLRMSGVAP